MNNTNKDIRDIVIDFRKKYNNTTTNEYKYTKEKCGNTKIRKVILVDKNNNEYNFNSTLDACIYIKGKTETNTSLDIIRSTLIKVARGERKSAWGFVNVLIEGINY